MVPPRVQPKYSTVKTVHYDLRHSAVSELSTFLVGVSRAGKPPPILDEAPWEPGERCEFGTLAQSTGL